MISLFAARDSAPAGRAPFVKAGFRRSLLLDAGFSSDDEERSSENGCQENPMNQTFKIESPGDVLKFIETVDGLHDALLHEAVLLHPGYVNENGLMFGDAELPNGRLIFQSQFADIAAVQLDLKRISTFRYDSTLRFRLEGEVKPGEVILYLSGKRNSAFSEIRAEEAEYRLLGSEGLGPRYKSVPLDEGA
jgi:hypothetical protein